MRELFGLHLLSVHLERHYVRVYDDPRYLDGHEVQHLVFGVSLGCWSHLDVRRYIAYQEDSPPGGFPDPEEILSVSGFDAGVGEKIVGVNRVEHGSGPEGSTRVDVQFQSGAVGEVELSFLHRFMTPLRMTHDSWTPHRRSNDPPLTYPHGCGPGRGAQLIADVCTTHDDCRESLVLARACAMKDLVLPRSFSFPQRARP